MLYLINGELSNAIDCLLALLGATFCVVDALSLRENIYTIDYATVISVYMGTRCQCHLDNCLSYIGL